MDRFENIFVEVNPNQAYPKTTSHAEKKTFMGESLIHFQSIGWMSYLSCGGGLCISGPGGGDNCVFPEFVGPTMSAQNRILLGSIVALRSDSFNTADILAVCPLC